jgi:hypothetical protein
VTLDFDATLVWVQSEHREQATPNYRHGFGYHLVYLDQTGEGLSGMRRPRSAGSNTAKDHTRMLDEALSQLPLPIRKGAPERGRGAGEAEVGRRQP